MQLSEKELRAFADEIRLETLKEFKNLGFGHIGGAMSIIEALAVLYGGIMKYDPKNPQLPDRDRLVISKGHAGPALYATLAILGFFPKEMLLELNQGGGRLPSHCDRLKTPGVDMTTGSLGQGISTAIGLALAAKMDGSGSGTYLILGDGECNEGQIWEGAMFAAHFKVDNLVAFVDWNKQQLDGWTKEIMDMGDLPGKFAAFGWHVQTVKGNDTSAIRRAVEAAKAEKGRPSVIVLDSVKGQGCHFAEGVDGNHHMNFSAEQIDEAIVRAEAVLSGSRKSL